VLFGIAFGKHPWLMLIATLLISGVLTGAIPLHFHHH
jgi:hypothetical protein